ncbi:P-loop containing nucleoside triphosphate hydrolase protein [Phakopsora pachyrhizi]|uniref:P-loop containing nucleoside triphosphate hydrolase protein n=1 Tax=Phakopsora pachyrhizi TaxID=170000 RepID=A0AAV0BLC2_PHAPC|nr:P-loop containing nucleoside triphosphate hydrolase protein [Phakopsora pachyrhizi]
MRKRYIDYSTHHERISNPDQTKSKRFLVGLTGIPGSGKTTLADRLVKSINDQAGSNVSTIISLDGCRSALDMFEDPAEAHRRRGAPFTFDSQAYCNYLEDLLNRSDPPPAPSFSHTLKDPVKDSIPILPNNSIIILEGLYTLLDDGDVWRKASSLVHLGVLIETPIEIARQRLIQRHVLSGICKNLDQASSRADFNDLPNGKFLMDHMRKPDLIVQSVQDNSMVLQCP